MTSPPPQNQAVRPGSTTENVGGKGVISSTMNTELSELQRPESLHHTHTQVETREESQCAGILRWGLLHGVRNGMAAVGRHPERRVIAQPCVWSSSKVGLFSLPVLGHLSGEAGGNESQFSSMSRSCVMQICSTEVEGREI